jgi:hypothetical protein
LVFGLIANIAFGQLWMTRWTFDGVTTTNTGVSPTFSVGTAVADVGIRTTGSLCSALHASATTVWSNPSGNGSAKALSANGWAAGDYFQFQTTATGCSGISFTWDQIGSNTGPKSWKVQYSTDGSAFTDVPNTVTNSTYDIANDTWSASGAVNTASTRTIDLSSITALNNAPNIYVRLVVAAGSTAINGTAIASAGTGRVDNVTFLGSVVAPVSLKSFNASLINNKVALNWNTSNEINVDGFSIEKSNDGRTFSNIGFVAARNAASANYTFNDVLAAGVNYYRLKITDKDGSFKYSSVVAVSAKQATKLDIFPNPVVNTATLSHTKAGDNATVKLITIDGKTVLTQNLQAGATQSSIDVSKLIKGNYLVVFENDGNRTSLQFVKQ